MQRSEQTFKLVGTYIELDNLLKASGIVANGAEAKIFIRTHCVKVNGEVEARVRRKLSAGDRVETEGFAILLA